MRNFARYLLLGGLAAGCTVNNVESGNTGGSAANTGGASNTGGKTGTGGTTTASSSTIAGSSSVAGSSNAGGTSAAQGGSSAAGGSTPTAGTTAVGGSSAIGGSSASGGTSGTQGGSTSTGGASSTTTAAGAGGATGGVTSTTAGGTTANGGTSAANGGAGGSSSTTNQVIKLDPNKDECDITTDTTWIKAVYDLSDCGSVLVAAKLTIQPGTIVKLPAAGNLAVQGDNPGPSGTIVASGTATEPIIFTSIDDDAHGGDTGGNGVSTPLQGDWGLTTGDVVVQGSGSEFNYVQFLYGSAGLRVDASSVEVKNCVFAHNSESGMLLTANAKSATVTGNAFFDNDGFPLRMATFVSLDATNIFHDPANAATKNTMQCIELVNAPTLDTATTIGVTELAFYGEFVVSSSLTLSANNVCFKCSMTQSIALDANGTIVNGANAVFTSALDDSIGGDCLGDGDLTPSNGDWEGIWVDTGSTTGWATATANIRYTDQTANPGTLPLH